MCISGLLLWIAVFVYECITEMRTNIPFPSGLFNYRLRYHCWLHRHSNSPKYFCATHATSTRQSLEKLRWTYWFPPLCGGNVLVLVSDIWNNTQRLNILSIAEIGAAQWNSEMCDSGSTVKFWSVCFGYSQIKRRKSKGETALAPTNINRAHKYSCATMFSILQLREGGSIELQISSHGYSVHKWHLNDPT